MARRNTTCFKPCSPRNFAVKRYLLSILLAFVALCSAPAQTSDQTVQPEQLLALVKEVQAQQAEIAANQAKIEAKLAELADTIRVARIYSSRSR